MSIANKLIVSLVALAAIAILSIYAGFSTLRKKEPVNNPRYFFISYSCRDNTKWADGSYCIVTNDTIPSYVTLEDQIYQAYKNCGYTEEHCLPIAVYEFRDSLEFKAFRRGLPDTGPFPQEICPKQDSLIHITNAIRIK